MLWLSFEGQKDVWELFSDNSYLSAILDRQGLPVAAPVDLRTKNTEMLLTTAIAGLLVKAQEKEFVMYPTVTAKNSKQKRGYMATVLSVLGRSRIPKSLVGEHLLTLGPESGKIWWLKKGNNTFRKSITANGLSCVERNPSGFFIILAISYNHLSLFQTHANMWFQQNDKFEQFLETVYPRQKLFHFKRHSIGSMR